ncbi:ABC transporter permease [bacterium]|nr:ABC transporter permease [bacterium]
MNNKAIIKETVKKHIPQHHLSSIRIMYRMAMETIYGMKRTGLMNFAIIAAMAAILTIFGALSRTSLSLTSFVDKLGDTFEISVYLKQNTDPTYMAARLKEFEHVKKITIVTKEQAWEEMNNDMDVSGLVNPLPDTLHVTVDKPENIVQVCDNIKKVPGIEDMYYAQEMAKKLQTLTSVFNTVTFLVLIIAAVLTIIIINSTIQLVIQSRKEEIEIMRLMGVSNWYIKIPLILQGATYGFLGALISLIPLNAVQNGLLKLHDFVNVQPSNFAMNIVIFLIFVVAVLCSACGSLFSIRKHIQV